MTMTKPLTAALLAAMLTTPAMAEKTKAQACEELALRSTYPVRLRNCRDPVHVSRECSELIHHWMRSAARAKYKCVRTPRGDLE